ncbi:RNA-directed DNA polymerase, eukaryota, Reverse transcriptase zinc-binding domain protein [Artemisia annua]|uniref:RNA-directed DNA polymerase, eukaryota, Reverse transcriptase zinc-binding domain protein n=1 Tax=Artemisia annua TaxID=35608 RepID=A0A2U1P6I7_ARTAN|nr:RNA-directed DNA polymerase, eukaryota, Reverse transcriptase zinc-binding domain protein [Artemisia annua]
MDRPSSYSRRSHWLDIVSEFRKLSGKGMDLISFVKKKVGNGESTSFWHDSWIGEIPLNNMYPRLYALEVDKHVSVASKLRDTSLTVEVELKMINSNSLLPILLLLFSLILVIDGLRS